MLFNDAFITLPKSKILDVVDKIPVDFENFAPSRFVMSLISEFEEASKATRPPKLSSVSEDDPRIITSDLWARRRPWYETRQDTPGMFGNNLLHVWLSQ